MEMRFVNNLKKGTVPVFVLKDGDKLEKHPFIHSSTFGGNPLACAAGIAAIHVILSENLAEHAAEKGVYMLDKLREVQKRFSYHFKDVRGKGLLIGLDFLNEKFGYKVTAGLFKRGVLVAGTLLGVKTVRIEPALTISYALMDEVVDRLNDTLHNLIRHHKHKP